MGLMLGGGGGAARSYLKYNAKAGRWSFRDTEGNETDVADPTFIADLENIATGWMWIEQGRMPERVMDPSPDQAAPRPSDKFKRGFILNVFSNNLFGGTAELSGTSNTLGNAIKAVYGQFEAEKGANAGKVPVIACQGTVPEKSKFGTNYRPNLTIAKWVDRPADLADESPAHPNDVYRATSTPAAPAPAAGGHVPPPSPRPMSSPGTEF